MNLEKSKKRIAKKVKMGFQGYPSIHITYNGENALTALEVVIRYLAEEGAPEQTERFKSVTDAREDEVIQSAIVKMIERADAKTVTVDETIHLQG